ncbi:MAG: discoidin domain-containing protein, partial [Candidatus Hydrogenedentota bacterium]
FLIDGNETTRWASDHSDIQSLTFDFGKLIELKRVVLLWETAFAKSYNFAVSTDNLNWKEIFATNDGKGGKEDYIFDSVECQYLKINFKKRKTEWGNSLWETYLFGQTSQTQSYKTEIEKDRSIKPILLILNYPKKIKAGSKIGVEVKWNNAPSQSDYKLLLQLENWDIKPGICFTKDIFSFESNGKQIFTLDIPLNIQAEKCRILAAFISKEKAWEDVYYMTATIKDVNIVR